MERLGIIDSGVQFSSARRLGILEGMSRSPPPVFSRGLPMRRAAAAAAEGDCRICAAAGDLWVRLSAAGGGDGVGGGEFVGQKIGGFSHESEHDLAVMVSDFMENGSSGADSRYSSDSDSGFSEFGCLYDRIMQHKHSMDQYERELLSAVHSILFSIGEADLALRMDGQCYASCIRHLLAEHLRFSGYDAALCTSRWQGDGKFFGGDHEYIDVILEGDGSPGRLIVDIDFQSHFEIARPAEFYDAILTSLPAVYVGSLPRLEQVLQIMVEAAKASLKQNSMPLPPWRSLAYLQAKWHSKYERALEPGRFHGVGGSSLDHRQCIEHLRRLKASLQIEAGADRILKPVAGDKKRRPKLERARRSLLRS